MPLYRRIPKRGFLPRNGRHTEYAVVNLEALERFAADTTVDPVMLAEAGLIRRSGRERVKVLGNGEVPHALMLKVHAISESARAKIEAKGGRVEILGAKQQDAGS